MLYRVALETGLRWSELRSLTPASFSLNKVPPTVRVEAGYSKHRREDVLPLRPETARDLLVYLSNKLPMAPAFPMWRERGAKMLRVDLEAAGIPPINEGGVVDFHSLRHMFISALAQSGVHPKTAQSLARHSTITLTMDCYSHTVLEDLSAALQKLPDLSFSDEALEVAATGTTDPAPQKSVASSVPFQGGFDGIERDKTGQAEHEKQVRAEKREVQKSAENKGFKGFLGSSSEEKVGTPSRIRTSDPLIKNQMPENSNQLKNQEVTENAKGSMASSVAFLCENRPDLALVVEAWDHLPEAIKAAIKALVETSRKVEE